MKKFLLTSMVFTLILAGCNQNDENQMNEQAHNMMPESSMDHSGMSAISSDEEFIEAMIPHHQEAIETSKIILDKSKNSELKKLAEGIVESQTAEIQMMKDWSKEWFGKEAQPAMYQAMMPDLSSLEEDALDQAYIQGMIGHHQGAIMMAEQIKEITKRQEILKMAEDIIRAQSQEVDLLKSWLNSEN